MSGSWCGGRPAWSPNSGVVADCGGGGDLAELAVLLDVGRVAHVAQELEAALANE